MSRIPIVSTQVPGNVPAAAVPGRRARYLLGGPAGWRFQMRLPVRLCASDSFLAKPSTILRVRIGPLSRREAEQRAALYGTICRAVFAIAEQEQEYRAMGKAGHEKENGGDLLDQVMAACQAGIASAMMSPSQALALAKGLQGALKTLSLGSEELEKGESGNATILAAAEGMTRDALRSVLLYAPDQKSAEASLASVPHIMPLPAVKPAPIVASAVASGMPLFSEVSQAYIDMRIKHDGPDHSDIKSLNMRRRTFFDLIGDRPVDSYTPKDLQDYVSLMKAWPANSSKRKEFAGMTTQEVLDANRDLHLKPLSRKALQDGYVANIKTMMRHEMTHKGYRDPFAGVRLRWPSTAAPPVAREEIGTDVINRVFQIGTKSGFMIDAMLPPLALLTARRLGLLVHLQGSDIRKKHGVYVAQAGGIVFNNTHWVRVPIKTAQSNSFFVLHNTLAEIGYLEWAMQQKGWLFPEAHEHPDASKYASKVTNRLMRSGGAAGGNIEVFHSLRGDSITGLRGKEKDRTNRLQAGHEMDNVHDSYGLQGLTAEECHSLANRPLNSEIDWDVLRGLDFDELAKGRRTRGRKPKSKT